MLVYGDLARRVGTAAALDDLAKLLRRLSAMPPGIDRHADLVAAFIVIGELAQGIADAEFEARGVDDRSPAQDAAMAALMTMADAVRRSWQSAFLDLRPLPPDILDGLSNAGLPETVLVKRPEGYAFYALYPESYLEAASAMGRERAVRVIGIRSIGIGLAALVASALGAPAPVTMRPAGDPFRREIKVSDDLAAELLEAQDARFAIVDEGPGLSGSSFGAVADWLEARGVDPRRIHFFPSHPNDLGPMSAAPHWQRWQNASRHVVDFDELVLRAANPMHRLEAWVTGLIGSPEGPAEDISGGGWRRHRFPDEAGWPPCHVQQERRKFLVHVGGETWLLKFVGLGREGAEKLDMAKRLHAAGLAPEPAGYRHGFLIERWLESARPITPATLDRAALIERLAAYIGFRATTFPAGPHEGAPLALLLTMARRNTALGLNETLAKSLDRWHSKVAGLEDQVRRVRTDNRLHVWEWLCTPDGPLIKTDALDHHAAHDLIGCQDVTWDLAGAAAEFDLSQAETDELCRHVEHVTGRPLDQDLLAFSGLCYLAFQLGYWALAAESLAGFPAEAIRTRQAADRYGAKLKATIERL